MKDAHAQVESHSTVSAVETMRALLAERIRRAEPGSGGGTARPGVEA